MSGSRAAGETGVPPDPDQTIATGLQAPDRTAATMGAGSDATMATVSGASSSSAGGDPVPGSRWGDFEIGRLLGRGGMGSVYAGQQLSLDRPVAIKVLPHHLSSHDGFRKRFELEARAVAKINSPHVVQVYGAGEFGGSHYFAMEYVEGRDLAARLKIGWRPTQTEAVELMLQAARGLAAAGEHGIVHRDIKPSNMMVTEQGQLKLMDFGLVKLSRSSSGLTMTGTVMGTVSYFSPEQGRGEECDLRTDIYALGIVLYEILTGVLPFTGDDATSVIYQHIHAEPRLPSEINPQISEECQAIILKCMQKDREHRYQDARQLITDLQLVAAGRAPATALFDPEQLRTGATMVRTQAFRKERRGRGLLVLVLLLLAAGAAGGIWWATREPDATRGTGPTGPVTPPPTGGGGRLDAQWLADARKLLNGGELEALQVKVSALNQQEADDPRVAELVAELGNKRAGRQVIEAEAALGAGDLEKAQQHLTLLAGAMPDHPRLQPLNERLTGIRRFRQELEAARSLFTTGEIEAARLRLEQISTVVEVPAADRSSLATMRQQVVAVQELLTTARNALTRDDLATARQAYLTALTKFDNVAANQGLKVLTVCEQFSAAMAAGDLTRAARHLDDLRAAGAGADVLVAREERLRFARLSEGVERALARQDFAEAEQQLALLEAAAPGSTQLEQLQRRVAVERELLGFARALEAKDLAAATARLEAIRQIDGERDPWQRAQERLKASRLAEEAQERRLADGLAAVRAIIEGATPDLAVAAERLAALEAEFGARDTVRAARLRLAQRRGELAVVDLLRGIDRAMLAGEREALAAAVGDVAHRQALAGMIGQDGLAIAHRPVGFAHGENGTVQVELELTVAMTIAPEAILRYRYTCRQQDGAWRVVLAERIGSD